MIADTTASSYWLHWRFLICALFVLLTIVVSSILIWKYEGSKKPRRQRIENELEAPGTLYKDEAWKSCLNCIHPAWLLAFRVFSFSVLSGLLIANVVTDGFGIFVFYTQWTFTLVTIYFGVASYLSIYRCCIGNMMADMNSDSEHGTYMPPVLGEPPNVYNTPNVRVSHASPQPASLSGYAFQIIFQICAGAVVLTDIVFWVLLYPSLPPRALDFLMVAMHSVNVVFLLGDTILNGLRFPMFRIGYLILWTSMYVIFQWILHACVSTRWPYEFMDLSSRYAPAWYTAVGLVQVPCFCVFALIIKLKSCLLSRYFPGRSS